MKTILIILLAWPAMVFSQTSQVYIKLTDGVGQQIKGDAVAKGFERWIQANAINSGGKNSTEFNFAMNVNGASASFKKALNNHEILLNGQVTVQSTNSSTGMPIISYTIALEKITVISCEETMGCDNLINTNVSLRAARIGWTYYQASRGGLQTVSNKYGWDAEVSAPWSGF